MNPIDLALQNQLLPASPSSAKDLRQIVSGGAQASISGVNQSALVVGDAVIEQTIGDGKSPLSQRVDVRLPLKWYFHLNVYPADIRPEQPDRPLPRGDLLELDRKYRLRIHASRNPDPTAHEDPAASPYTQHGVYIPSPVELVVEAATLRSGSLPGLMAAIEPLSPDRVADWTHEVVLSIPHDFTEGEIRLRLLLVERNAAPGLPVTECAFPVRTNPLAKPQIAPERHLLAVGSVLPVGTAILHLSAINPKNFRATSFHRNRPNRPLSTDPIPSPRPRLELCSGGIAFLKAMRDALHDFASDQTGNLGPWLQDLVALHGDDTALILIDQTESGIPWELFRFQDGTRLGARIRVVRWIEAQYRDAPLRLGLGEECLHGRLAALIHADNGELDGYPFLEEDERFPNVQALERTLMEAIGPPGPVGMVYLGSEQILRYGDEDDALSAFSENLAPPGVRVRFEYAEGRLSPRPLFFADSPYSGRILRDGDRSCGLAKSLLAQVASGLIGTLGPVEREHALRIARRFLEAYQTDEGLRPADLLRQLRRETDALGPMATDADYYPYLYAYYGNPGAVIRMPPPCPGCVSEATHA